VSEYTASSDAKDWRTFAGGFGLAGLAGLGAAWAGHEILHGWMAASLSYSGGMFAGWLELAGLAIGGPMMFLAVGGVVMAWQRRGGVEVTADGVRRTYAPGRCRFVAWEKIAGYRTKPAGGVELIDANGKWLFTIPNSIAGYRDCVAEVREKGIGALPPKMNVSAGWKPKGWKEHFQSWGLWFGIFGIAERGNVVEHLVGLLIALASIAWIWADNRKQADPARRGRWRSSISTVVVGGVTARLLLLALSHLFPRHSH
jgi:hypothetical protein